MKNEKLCHHLSNQNPRVRMLNVATKTKQKEFYGQTECAKCMCSAFIYCLKKKKTIKNIEHYEEKDAGGKYLRLRLHVCVCARAHKCANVCWTSFTSLVIRCTESILRIHII